MDVLTPQLFDVLIIINIIISLALAVWRFMRDLRRPLSTRSSWSEEGAEDER